MRADSADPTEGPDGRPRKKALAYCNVVWSRSRRAQGRPCGRRKVNTFVPGSPRALDKNKSSGLGRNHGHEDFAQLSNIGGSSPQKRIRRFCRSQRPRRSSHHGQRSSSTQCHRLHFFSHHSSRSGSSWEKTLERYVFTNFKIRLCTCKAPLADCEHFSEILRAGAATIMFPRVDPRLWPRN